MTDGSIDFTFLVASGADCAAFLGLVPASCPIVLLRLLAPRGATGFSAAMISSEEHTSELQSLMRISYAVFCWKQKRGTAPRRDTTGTAHISTEFNTSTLIYPVY